jgi:hypothetical protein
MQQLCVDACERYLSSLSFGLPLCLLDPKFQVPAGLGFEKHAVPRCDAAAERQGFRIALRAHSLLQSRMVLIAKASERVEAMIYSR